VEIHSGQNQITHPIPSLGVAFAACSTAAFFTTKEIMTIAQILWDTFSGEREFDSRDIERRLPTIKLSTAQSTINRFEGIHFVRIANGLYRCHGVRPPDSKMGRKPKKSLLQIAKSWLSMPITGWRK